MRENLSGATAWSGVFVVVAACLGPVWDDWSGSVVAPFGGIDAMLQLGILEWTARHWTEPSVWMDLPIFHPVPGALGFMDTLLGQAWLVLPLRHWFDPTAAGLYNFAFLGSLVAAILAAGFLWRATGGRWWTAEPRGLRDGRGAHAPLRGHTAPADGRGACACRHARDGGRRLSMAAAEVPRDALHQVTRRRPPSAAAPDQLGAARVGSRADRLTERGPHTCRTDPLAS